MVYIIKTICRPSDVYPYGRDQIQKTLDGYRAEIEDFRPPKAGEEYIEISGGNIEKAEADWLDRPSHCRFIIRRVLLSSVYWWE